MAHPHQLLIMRHADAEAGAPGDQDVSRALTSAGRARAAARRQVVLDAAPELVLCSTAERARQTLVAIGPLEAEVVVEERLYTASVTTLLLRLAEVPEAVGTVLLVGHLPTVAVLAGELLGDGAEGLRFEPAALAHLALADPWAGLRPSSASLLAFHR